MFKHDKQTAERAGGNVRQGDISPAVMVKVWDAAIGYVNLKVLNDSGTDTWETSIFPGDGERQWQWPVLAA